MESRWYKWRETKKEISQLSLRKIYCYNDVKFTVTPSPNTSEQKQKYLLRSLEYTNETSVLIRPREKSNNFLQMY